MPLPYRYLTSLMLGTTEKECWSTSGEGTEVALRRRGWSPKPIDMMLFTPFSCGPYFGSSGNAADNGKCPERTEPVLDGRPQSRLARVVNSLRVIAPELPLRSAFWSFSEREQEIELPGEPDFHIHACQGQPQRPCYGYAFSLDRKGRFNAERAKAQVVNIPVRLWSRLQKGEIIETEEGAVLTPDMVLGAGPQRSEAGLFLPPTPVPAKTLSDTRAGRRPSDLRRNVRRTGKCCKGTRKKHMTSLPRRLTLPERPARNRCG